MKKLFLVFVMFMAVSGVANAANFNYIQCNVSGSSSFSINEIKFKVTGSADEILTYNHVFLEVRDTSNNLVYIFDKRIYPFVSVIHVKRDVVQAGYTYRLYTLQSDINRSGTCD